MLMAEVAIPALTKLCSVVMNGAGHESTGLATPVHKSQVRPKQLVSNTSLMESMNTARRNLIDLERRSTVGRGMFSRGSMPGYYKRVGP